MKKLYDRYVLPHLINRACATGVLRRERAKVIPWAQGVVLDIGIGSGHNLAHYRPQEVKEILGLDPSATLVSRGRHRFEACPIAVEVLTAGAENMPVEDSAVDTVVLTYTACSIPDIGSAFEEIRRVLKPSGQLLFVEHGRAPDLRVARWQDRLNAPWAALAGGCQLNRDFPALLAHHGFRVDHLEATYSRGTPRWLGFLTSGRARP